MLKEDFIARICHASWCAYQLGAWQKYNCEPTSDDLASCVNTLQALISNPTMTTEENHNNWMRYRLDNGWVYGEVKDVAKKIHPDLVPFDELSISDQNKGVMFLEAHSFAVSLWERIVTPTGSTPP